MSSSGHSLKIFCSELVVFHAVCTCIWVCKENLFAFYFCISALKSRIKISRNLLNTEQIAYLVYPSTELLLTIATLIPMGTTSSTSRKLPLLFIYIYLAFQVVAPNYTCSNSVCIHIKMRSYIHIQMFGIYLLQTKLF